MKTAATAVAIALMAFAIGCDGGPAGSASKEASESGSEVVEETGDVVDATAAAVGDAEMDVDVNQGIADTYATVAPKELAQLCASPLPQASQEKIMAKILGPQIIRQDGDVGEVMDLLFDRC